MKTIADKQKLSNGVDAVGLPEKAKRKSVGTGWVVRNPEVKNYEQYCIDRNTVSILTDKQEIIPVCVVSNETLQNIVFPKGLDEKGSLVTWVCSPNSTVPIIIGTLNSTKQKPTLNKSNSFQLQRGDGDTNAMVEGDGDKGEINIFAKGVTGGKLNIKLLDRRLLALLDMYVQGDINIDAEGSVNIRADRGFVVNLDSNDVNGKEIKATVGYEMEKGFFITDEWNNVITTSDKAITVTTVKDGTIRLKGDQNAEEPALLGDATVKLLNDILDNISGIASTVAGLNVNTVSGTVLPNVSASALKIKSKVKTLQGNINNLKSKNIKLS